MNLPATDTIYGLSSGAPPAGVAVVRVSGPAVRFAFEILTGSVPEPRRAVLRKLGGAEGGGIDRGLVLFFPGPESFTGEDVGEFQIHGGRAVVAALLRALGGVPGARPAEPGEFTRRAFLNRRLDLSQVEGLADLVRAETEVQRQQALRQAEGALRSVVEEWRHRLLRARALVEAELDFGEEEDIRTEVVGEAAVLAEAIAREIRAELDRSANARRIREGQTVVILGPPNVGKSSLLNALARDEVAIVSPEPGTTRDVVETRLDLGGYAVNLVDTAGLREAETAVEAEGVRRAEMRARSADVVLWVEDCRSPLNGGLPALEGATVVKVGNKLDLATAEVERASAAGRFDVLLSVRTGEGMDGLVERLRVLAGDGQDGGTPGLVSRDRQSRALLDCVAALERGMTARAAEVLAEELRLACDALGRVTGRTDVERVLDIIFAEFCIGK